MPELSQEDQEFLDSLNKCVQALGNAIFCTVRAANGNTTIAVMKAAWDDVTNEIAKSAQAAAE
jgi:hypothetical protein